ncbi:hypothetical protein F4821DRAFT_254704 [Hypoxylon rubiginosum]|uniref:Uncharacterized protein n=1 Tax=Hypoxylon rubiginosum TaxID=110542 RepID=A0ACC0DGJ2_9PEZI|nr:hypothetical protein F4821DRAFT_254704 [Hypoxylon rubiginosum]
MLVWHEFTVARLGDRLGWARIALVDPPEIPIHRYRDRDIPPERIARVQSRPLWARKFWLASRVESPPRYDATGGLPPCHRSWVSLLSFGISFSVTPAGLEILKRWQASALCFSLLPNTVKSAVLGANYRVVWPPASTMHPI